MVEFLVAEFPLEWRKLDNEEFWRKVTPLLQIYVTGGMTRPIPDGAKWEPIDCLVDGNNVVVVANMKETEK